MPMPVLGDNHSYMYLSKSSQKRDYLPFEDVKFTGKLGLKPFLKMGNMVDR